MCFERIGEGAYFLGEGAYFSLICMIKIKDKKKVKTS